VTIRERDSMQQIRVPGRDLGTVFEGLFGGAGWDAVAASYPRADG
jgi:glycyl-tRNA synthetase (class II)